jgi:hypothetical protein
MDNKDLLIEKLEEYIKFLGEEVNKYASLSITHSYMGVDIDVVQEGVKLREEIRKLKEKASV